MRAPQEVVSEEAFRKVAERLNDEEFRRMLFTDPSKGISEAGLQIPADDIEKIRALVASGSEQIDSSFNEGLVLSSSPGF